MIVLSHIWKFPKIRGPQYRPQYTIVLIMGTPKKVPLILGNYHLLPNPLKHQEELGAVKSFRGYVGFRV